MSNLFSRATSYEKITILPLQTVPAKSSKIFKIFGEGCSTNWTLFFLQIGWDHQAFPSPLYSFIYLSCFVNASAGHAIRHIDIGLKRFYCITVASTLNQGLRESHLEVLAWESWAYQRFVCFYWMVCLCMFKWQYHYPGMKRSQGLRDLCRNAWRSVTWHRKNDDLTEE